MKIISNLAAAERAWRRMIEILFKPFDFANWLLLALCAWLSILGTSRDTSFQQLIDMLKGNFIRDDEQTMNTVLEKLKQGQNNILREVIDIDAIRQISPITILAIIAGLFTLGIVLMWIRSQADFIFIDNVINKSKAFISSFKNNVSLGNSAFLWRIGYYIFSGLLTCVVMMIPLGLSIGWIQNCVNQGKLTTPGVLAVIGLVLAVLFGIIMGIILKLTLFYFLEFIVPLMFIKRVKSFEACGIFWDIFRNYTWTFLKYAVLYLLLLIAATFLILVAVACTCCLLAIPLSIPYVATAILLPVAVYFRLLGLELLNQFYKEEIL